MKKKMILRKEALIISLFWKAGRPEKTMKRFGLL